MLLTSGGARNPTLVSALAGLVGRPFGEAIVCVVLTASVAIPGDKGWLLDEFELLRGLAWRQIDVLDVGSTPRDQVEERLRSAEVVLVEGGDEYHLAKTILGRDLVRLFSELVRTKVYVGVSAGSMIFSKHSGEVVGALFGDAGADGVVPAFGFFDWFVKPHLNSPSFAGRDDAWAQRIGSAADFPIYFLDDESALIVQGEVGEATVEVVGEGRWRLVPGHAG
jgi:dipeptidase E